MLGVSPRTVSKWIDRGYIPSWHVNKDRRVLISDLVKFAESRNIPIRQPDMVSLERVYLPQGVVELQEKLSELKTKIDIMQETLSAAEECLLKGTVSLGDPNTVKVNAELRRTFLTKLDRQRVLVGTAKSE
jgi:hypothetical protein